MSSTRRARGLLVRAVAVAALALGAMGVAVAPASALGQSASGFATGPVGVQQTITAQSICPNSVLELTVVYTNGVTYNSAPVTADMVGNATIYWTPTAIGTINQAYIQVLNGGCSNYNLLTPPSTVQITQIPTTTTVSAPNTTTVGTATTITVYVQSQSPSSYAPTGSVLVTDANGAKITQMGLTPGPGAGQSYAYWRFTPPSSGNYIFVAKYLGDANAAVSASPQDVMIATPSGGTISLAAPATMTQGVPVTLVASVAPAGVQGSVGFTLNGAPISGSIPIVNNQASFLWTPNVVGNVTLGASYTTNQGGSGSTSDKVTIVAGPVSKDVITLVQPGWGPWNPNGTYTLGNGSSFPFQASTLSGAAVTLSETGPCQVSGLTITIDTGSGQCNLVATSPGGNGYAGVQYGYTVNIIPGNQTATLAAPQSGNVNAGKTLTLESPSQTDTNAGQNITWKITKGKNSVCKLKFPSNGAVKLKILKKGQCNVKGSAPGVSGEWNPYTVLRSYRGV